MTQTKAKTQDSGAAAAAPDKVEPGKSSESFDQWAIVELMGHRKLAGKCAGLIARGFFKSPMGVSAAQKELRRLGSDQPTTNVRRALDKLKEQGFLTSETEGYQAVEGMKVNIVETK